MRAVCKSGQEACRREYKGADTTGKRWEGVGRKERVGRIGGKVRPPRAPDVRDERQRGLRRSERTEGKERTGFVRTLAQYVR